MAAMPDAAPPAGFTAAHHALLFAWIARGVLQRAGEERGSEIVRSAVRRYGQQRGRRMALRARANGHPLDMLSFLVYGELQVGPGETEQIVLANAPDLVTRVQRCPWNTAWREHGVLEPGRLYCQEIDSALIRGFNPDLRITVGKTQSNDGEPCEFIFHEARLGGLNKLRHLAGKSIWPGKRARLPWEYHAGNLCKTATEAISQALGPAEGRSVQQAALEEFAASFGTAAAEIVRGHEATDFDAVPRRPMT
jgi:hypothetical protein